MILFDRCDITLTTRTYDQFGTDGKHQALVA